MNLPETVLGKATATALKTRASTPILIIGTDTFTCRELVVKADCTSFNAARNLTRLFNEHLNVPNLKHVFYKVPPTALAIPRLGSVSLAVLGAAFEAKGLGGSEPLLNYIRQHTHANGKSVEEQMVTFVTLKHREAKELQEERKRGRTRKQQRRDKAHNLRLARGHYAEAG